MNKIKQLTVIKNGKLSYDKAIKLGLDISKLRDDGLITVKIVKNKSFDVPKDVPKYASKYKFTRKRYGIKDIDSEDKTISITEKGLKFLKKSVKKEVEEEPSTKETEVEDDLQDQ
jgi:hypothetical protein